jgi:hypothetical protein
VNAAVLAQEDIEIAEASQEQRSLIPLTDRNMDGALYPVPEDKAFLSGDWRDGGDIAGIALELIAKHPALFADAARFAIDYRWTRKGGNEGHKVKLGMCVRVSGLTKAFAPHLDFVIWLAADNCREGEFTYFQIEALIFHELLHIGSSDKGKPAIVPHDLEAFTREVREYGLWKTDVERMGEAFRQLALDVE